MPTLTISKIEVNGTEYDIEDTTARSSLNNKQNLITASGLLKGNGSGGVTAATAGTDYQAAGNYMVQGVDYVTAGKKSGTTMGSGATAEGYQTTASGSYTHAEGYQTTASGNYAHAEGYQTTASDLYSHAEGRITEAAAPDSHAEGYSTHTYGAKSHAEGFSSKANGANSHAEGYGTNATGENSHAEGYAAIANGVNSHAEGYGTTATGDNAHAEGIGSVAVGDRSHAEGSYRVTYGSHSHAEGMGLDDYSGATTVSLTGTANTATYTCSSMTSIDVGRFLVYNRNVRQITSVDTTNSKVTVNSTFGDALSSATVSIMTGAANYAHAEGRTTSATGGSSHAEGFRTVASGGNSHAEGYNTKATQGNAHAEGNGSEALGTEAHAEGKSTHAEGVASHAEGFSGYARGNYSHSEGLQCVAQRRSQHVFGENNVLDTEGTGYDVRGQFVEIVGNGASASQRTNARTLDWSGNETLAGKLTIGTGPTNNMDVATKQYVDDKAPNPHAVNANTYGLGSSSVYGHVKLSDAAAGSSNSTAGIAATPLAVKTTYDYITDSINTNGNIIRNWYFPDPVNTRNKNPYESAPEYVIDGWGGDPSSNRKFSSIQLGSAGIRFITNSTNIGRINQIIPSKYKGCTVTFSMLIANVNSGTVTIGMGSMSHSNSLPQLANGWSTVAGTSAGLITKTYTIGSDATTFGVFIQGSESSDFTIKAVKLELGSTQTLAKQINGIWVLLDTSNKSLEELKCRLDQSDNTDSYAILPIIGNTNQTQANAAIRTALNLPIAQSSVLSNCTNANLESGIYIMNSSSTTNYPSGVGSYAMLIHTRYNSTYCAQLALAVSGTVTVHVAYRRCYNGTWQNGWSTILQ